MKIGVVGFGHFAQIVGACLRQKGFGILQFDWEPYLKRAGQREARDEPGWKEMAFPPVVPPHDEDFALHQADLVWVAYDVPLDEWGAPVTDEILARIQRLHAAVPPHVPFLVSCQWPVGTTRTIAARCTGREFVYVMENVRAGKAIADFRANPIPLLATDPLIARSPVVDAFVRACTITWPPVLSWESAELAKHTTNAFIALNIAFINEIARIANAVNADANDVSRALLSDARVSPTAPLKPGPPFGGGSLARDLMVLNELGATHKLHIPIIDAILESNGE